MEQLKEILTRRNIDFTALESGRIRIIFSPTEDQSLVFQLFVLPFTDNLGDSYLRFTIVPFIAQPDNGYPSELYIVIGEANHHVPRAKFAFDADGDLELLLDMRADAFNEDQFQHAFQLLIDYGSAYHPQLAQITGA